MEDDTAEIELVYRTLDPGGHCLIFVPAFEWLYGAFDRRVGHCRRYRKPDLEARCRSVGFEIAYARYFDIGGIVPWWVKFRLFGSQDLSPRTVRWYDKFAVPLLRRLETAFPVPIGKNILVVARKPSRQE